MLEYNVEFYFKWIEQKYYEKYEKYFVGISLEIIYNLSVQHAFFFVTQQCFEWSIWFKFKCDISNLHFICFAAIM